MLRYLSESRRSVCSADGSTHTESNKLYRKVKHRYRPNLSPRQRPTAKSRHDQAALAASAEARGATHRARPSRSIENSRFGTPRRTGHRLPCFSTFFVSLFQVSSLVFFSVRDVLTTPLLRSKFYYKSAAARIWAAGQFFFTLHRSFIYVVFDSFIVQCEGRAGDVVAALEILKEERGCAHSDGWLSLFITRFWYMRYSSSSE